MILVKPFLYPMTPLVRRHGPRGDRDFTSFKPWLRDDYSFRCASCLERERWAPDRSGSSSVDHFLPKATHPARATDYPNLVYACTRCNTIRGTQPCHLDPDRDAFGEHLRIADDGTAIGLTPRGIKTILLFRLNEDPAISNRKRYLTILRAMEERPGNEFVRKLYTDSFQYPVDLEDLSDLRPPGGNTRPLGIAESHFARRRRGELPECY